MKRNFKSALKLVLVHEGGWADHPKDPGGATMKGVTLTTFQRFFGSDKGKQDLRNISDAELAEIYRTGYWDKCHCNELPKGLDYAVFDAAVNSGPGRSAKWLQAAVGARQDGGIGPKTLEKLKQHEPVTVTDDICDLRLTFLRSLTHWSTFGRGWNRRVEGVRSVAIAMANGRVDDGQAHKPSIDYKTVKRNSRGPWVRKLQQALKLQVDGRFGAATEKALKQWQAENGLEADGIAGRVTYRSLGLLA